MEETLGWVIVVIAILVLLIVGLNYLPGGIYWSLAVLGFAVHYSLDQLFSANLIPNAPWLMWIIWGAVIGAAFAFWTLAPIYGIRKQRGYILLAPLAPMLLLMAVRLLLQR